MQKLAKITIAENDNFEYQTEIKASKPNPIIRQNLLPMCCYNEAVEELGLTQATCEKLGIGFLKYGRSPLRGRVIMQLRDARLNKAYTKRQQAVLSHIGLPDQSNEGHWVYPGFNQRKDLFGQERLWLDEHTRNQASEQNSIILTDDPLGLAKAYQYGIKNIISTLAKTPSEEQLLQASHLAKENKVTSIKLILLRRMNTAKSDFKIDDIQFTQFDWGVRFNANNTEAIGIPNNITSLSHFSKKQLLWLQKIALL